MITETIIYDTTMTHIHLKADLINYMLGLGKMRIGIPRIQVDRSFRNIFDAFEIPFPTGGNHGVYRQLKKEGVFEGVTNYTHDGEYSSINTLFHDMPSFYKFVDNFVDWIVENSKVSKPTVEHIIE